MCENRDKQWKVGELAEATGLTVRTLHHYDELGLLVPSERSFAGYRLYGEGDVRRLYRIVALRRLGLRLDEIGELLDGNALDRQDEPSIDQLITTMEALTMHEKYYTPEQLERLRRRGDELGQEAIDAAQREWAEIFDALRDEMDAGTDPADPKLDPYRRRARELLRAFTSGDADIIASMDRMWSSEDPETVSRGIIDRELSRYVNRVFDAPSASR